MHTDQAGPDTIVLVHGLWMTPRSWENWVPYFNNPAKRHQAPGFTPEQFRYGFTNTLSAEDSKAVYDRYHIPAPGSWVWARVHRELEAGQAGDGGRLRQR